MDQVPRPISRRELWLGGALALLAPGAVSAAAADFGTAIDIAGRQRMLTQRIVKAYCQVGLEVNPEASRHQLREAVLRFDERRIWLNRHASGAPARKALGRVAGLWPAFRRLASGAVERQRAKTLALRSEELLRSAHDVVVALQDQAGSQQAKLVAISGRQRMLSQRMAKCYMLRAWEADSPEIRDQLDSAANEFSGAHALLRAAPENTPAIATELDAVELQWDWFASAIHVQGQQSYALVVADASEEILQRMDRVTALYAQLVP